MIPGQESEMEEEIKDYILWRENYRPGLDLLIDLVNARLKTGQPYREGGLFDQPYFLVSYIEPWIDQAYKDLHRMQSTEPQLFPSEEQQFFDGLQDLINRGR